MTYLLEPMECRHHDQSRRMITLAAGLVSPGRAIVLGAGACDEIPLSGLAARFGLVALNDSNEQLLKQGVAAAGLDQAGDKKVVLHISDLTGITETVLNQIDAALAASEDAPEGIEKIAQVLARQSPAPCNTEGRFDLVVASCVLSQLHFAVTHRAYQLFEQRFGGQVVQLRESPRWTSALYDLARRMEASFIDDLVCLVADKGLIYVSETTQMCHVQLNSTGKWRTEGTYRMLRSADLRDYFDERFTIVEQGRWQWVVAPPTREGETGRLFDVQALVLRV